jgi:hypothetical protein
MIPNEYSFTHYLAAKQSVDDRALNRKVWDQLGRELAARQDNGPLRVLEIGCGIGTMIERLVGAGLFEQAHYTAVDLELENIDLACHRLADWVGKPCGRTETYPAWFSLGAPRNSNRPSGSETPRLRQPSSGHDTVGPLVAHAFRPGRPAGIPAPTFPPAEIWRIVLLHPQLRRGRLWNRRSIQNLTPWSSRSITARWMRRRVAGKPSGTAILAGTYSTTCVKPGRKFSKQELGLLVYPGRDGYPEDEAYFLHFIIHTMFEALCERPEIDPARLARWAGCRHGQVERRELVYLAHQLDFLGIRPAAIEVDGW